jgi:hypothetical protein
VEHFARRSQEKDFFWTEVSSIMGVTIYAAEKVLLIKLTLELFDRGPTFYVKPDNQIKYPWHPTDRVANTGTDTVTNDDDAGVDRN